MERFNKLYPKYHGSFAQRVICDDTYAQTIIDDFKVPDKEPIIAVSVDMMDTGIDVPQCVNLVFFKKVRSKAKFWQMIGRGTRLCKGLTCTDQIDGEYARAISELFLTTAATSSISVLTRKAMNQRKPNPSRRTFLASR